MRFQIKYVEKNEGKKSDTDHTPREMLLLAANTEDMTDWMMKLQMLIIEKHAGFV